VNDEFSNGTTSAQGTVYHAGRLFLNGAGFWVRVKKGNYNQYSDINEEDTTSGWVYNDSPADNSCEGT
jgi:hypothetical protein